jgi:uncharacterized YccA/Bax inhibitor family protein
MSNPVFSSKNSPFNTEGSYNPLSGEVQEALPVNGAGLMTVKSSIQKTGILFSILIAMTVVGWAFLPPIVLTPVLLVGFVVGLVIAFKKKISVPLIITYAAVEGLLVGGISGYMEQMFPGVVSQAVLATLTVFAVVLFLFSQGILKTTPKIRKIFFISLISYVVFGFVNLGLMMFGVIPGMFGLYSAEINGIPIGLVIGGLAIIMASISLVMDFEFIRDGESKGLPEKYSWLGAHGLVVTMVWLYLEILRLLATIASNNR